MENEMNNSAANTQEAGVEATTEAQVSQAPPAGAESSAAGTVTQTEGEAQQQGSQTETGTERTVQNAEQNHRFAEMRRREQREQVFRDLLGDTINPETGRPFSNMREFAAWKEHQRQAGEAKAAGLDPASYAQLEARITQHVKETDPDIQRQTAELNQFRAMQMQQVFDQDLKAIKKAYPDEKAASVTELGEEYMTMMATGKVSALAAYEAVRAQKNRQAPPPPSMGDVGAAGKEQGFFTKEEVQKMTPAQVSKNFEKIRASMSKW